MSNKSKMSKKKAVGKAAAAVKKADAKTLKAIIIAAIVIVLILVIIFGVLYVINPDLIYKILGINRNNAGGGTLPGGVEGDTMQVNFVNVGQGDCILIKFPDGKTMIIDAGGSTLASGVKYSDSIEKCIDEMDIVKFDYLLLTHSDSDHVDYMDNIINGYDVGTIYRPAFLSKSETADRVTGVVTTDAYDNFVRGARAEGAKIIKNIGKQVIVGEGYSMDLYCPPISAYSIENVGTNIDAKEKNVVSPICDLKFGGRSVIFTGDAESKENAGNGAEEQFYTVNYPDVTIDCDVLKVGHHGSKASASNKFLEFIDPEFAVISVGNNSHGHPSAEVISKLNSYRDKRPDTDFDGISKTYITQDVGRVLLTIGTNGGMDFNTLMY